MLRKDSSVENTDKGKHHTQYIYKYIHMQKLCYLGKIKTDDITHSLLISEKKKDQAISIKLFAFKILNKVLSIFKLIKTNFVLLRYLNDYHCVFQDTCSLYISIVSYKERRYK